MTSKYSSGYYYKLGKEKFKIGLCDTESYGRYWHKYGFQGAHKGFGLRTYIGVCKETLESDTKARDGVGGVGCVCVETTPSDLRTHS